MLTCNVALTPQAVHNEFRGRAGQHAYETHMAASQPSIPSSLKFKWAATEQVESAINHQSRRRCASVAAKLPCLLASCAPLHALHDAISWTEVGCGEWSMHEEAS